MSEYFLGGLRTSEKIEIKQEGMKKLRLYEYQGKEMFKEMQIPVPDGKITKSAQEAREIAVSLGFPVVIKAQVLRGGRGKAGLIKNANNAQEAENLAAQILAQLAEEEVLLIETAIQADREAYIGITVDDIKGVPVIVISSEGGIHIEETAEKDKNKIISAFIDPVKGLYQHQALTLAKKAGFQSEIAVKVAQIACNLYRTFEKFDCDTAEINPVMINSKTKELIAGDSKVNIDEYAFGRQPKIAAYRKERKNENDSGIFFVDLGGNIGIVSGGASGTMMLCDSIKVMGGEPGNFLDGTGGNSSKSVAAKSKVVLAEVSSNARYKVLLFNFNLSASSLKEIVDGVVMAVTEMPVKVPVVASIRATGAALNKMSLTQAKTILQEHGIVLSLTLEDAIKTAIELSKR